MQLLHTHASCCRAVARLAWKGALRVAITRSRCTNVGATTISTLDGTEPASEAQERAAAAPSAHAAAAAAAAATAACMCMHACVGQPRAAIWQPAALGGARRGWQAHVRAESRAGGGTAAACAHCAATAAAAAGRTCIQVLDQLLHGVDRAVALPVAAGHRGRERGQAGERVRVAAAAAAPSAARRAVGGWAPAPSPVRLGGQHPSPRFEGVQGAGGGWERPEPGAKRTRAPRCAWATPPLGSPADEEAAAAPRHHLQAGTAAAAPGAGQRRAHALGH